MKCLSRVVVCAILLLSPLVSSAAEPTGTAWLDIETPVAYTFNTATISSPDGLSGFARLYGIAADGTRTALFEARFGRLKSLEALWYADPGFLWLGVECRDGAGRDIGATVRLDPGLSGQAQSIDAETSILAALSFPYRLQPWRGPPLEFTVVDPGLEALAAAAVSRLFSPVKSVWPLVTLLVWSILAAGVAERGKRDALAMAVFIAGSALAALAVAATGSDTPELYSLPVQNQGSVIVRSVQKQGTYNEVLWRGNTSGADDRAGLRYLALRSPLAAAIPVSALASYRRLRFAEPPLVLRQSDGVLVFAPARFQAAWGLHD